MPAHGGTVVGPYPVWSPRPSQHCPCVTPGVFYETDKALEGGGGAEKDFRLPKSAGVPLPASRRECARPRWKAGGSQDLRQPHQGEGSQLSLPLPLGNFRVPKTPDMGGGEEGVHLGVLRPDAALTGK